MPISVIANPPTLTWAHFTPVASLIDPNDGTAIDALTRFDFVIPRATAPRTVDGMQAYPESFTITVTPNAQVVTGTNQTAGLLAHEQLHYDIGIMTVRQFARDLQSLRAPDLAGLIRKTQESQRLHTVTRARILQNRIDLDTRHGTNAHYQRVWADRIRAAVAVPTTTQVGGFFL